MEFKSIQTEHDPSQAPTFFIKLIARDLARLAERDLKVIGVGLASLPILTAIYRGQACNQAELARLLRLKQPSVAQTLARLERDGFILRRPDPYHGRRSLITLTASALKVLPESRVALDIGNETALANISDEERVTLLGLLKRMHDNIKEKI